MDFLQNHIESLIFCAAEPVKIDEIRQCLNEMFEADVPEEDITNAIDVLLKKYEGDTYPFQIYRIGGGYQFLTKPAYQSSLSIFLKQKSKKRLSTSALETVAIIAYKQPITKHQIEQIRGVNCDYAIQKLLEKELIEIQGKSDGVGRPILYGTSKKFMEYFGIDSLKDLPMPKDFSSEENTIGEEKDTEFQVNKEAGNEPEIEDKQSSVTINEEPEGQQQDNITDNEQEEQDSESEQRNEDQ
ncbi:MAG TPA: SMC-Scp complex subunit ScpB [Cytophagaceae bacterium]